MRSLGVFSLFVLAVCVASAGAANTLLVGSNKPYHRIQDAINVCSNGDTILVDPGTYVGVDGCMLFDGPSNVTVKGNGGRPVVDMGPDHLVSVWGKGTCTITGNSSNITIENFEFINATIRDVPPYNDNGYNAAGVCFDGGGLCRIVNCVVHDCNWGIRGTTTKGAEMLVENCVVYGNGMPGGQGAPHNAYVGSGGGLDSATFQYNWMYNANIAYDIKSNARNTKILYNRLGDEITDPNTTPPTTGGGEGIIDIPKAGLSYVMGNLIIKGFTAVNGTCLRYAEEGATAGYSTQLYFLYNTILAERYSGTTTVCSIASGTAPAFIANNFFVKYNDGDSLVGSGSYWDVPIFASNVQIYEHQTQAEADIGMVNYGPRTDGSTWMETTSWIDANLVAGSVAEDGAVTYSTKPGDGYVPATGEDGFSLVPLKQLVLPSATAMPSGETRSDCNDAGAYELDNNASAAQKPVVFAGSSAPDPALTTTFSQRPSRRRTERSWAW